MSSGSVMKKASEKASIACRGDIASKLEFAIVGGGIGGLATALHLIKKGIRVKVFEQDPSFRFRRQGFGLTLQQGGLALSSLGLGDAVAKAAAYSQSHFVFDSTGRIVAFWGPTWTRRAREHQKLKEDSSASDEEGGRGGGNASEETEDGKAGAEGSGRRKWETPKWQRLGAHNLHIPRQALREILLNALPPDTVVWGKQLRNVRTLDRSSAIATRPEQPAQSDANAASDASEGGGLPAGSSLVELTFEDGGSHIASACVACDGIYSVTRRLCLPEAAPLRYLGYLVVLGIFPNASFPLCQERAFQSSDGVTRMFAMPFTLQESMWQLSWPVSEEESLRIAKDASALQQEALTRCRGWHEPIEDMISAAPLDMIAGYPAYDRPAPSAAEILPSSSPDSLLAIAGDAAHCMSPFKGQGANQALLDGFVLAESVHRHTAPNRRHWTKNYQGLSKPDSLPADASHEEVSARLAAALRDFEGEMMQRTRSKVELSHKSVALLHQPAFLEPEFHLQRKSLGGDETLRQVERLRVAGVSAADAKIAGKLESLAFGIEELPETETTEELST